MQQNSHSAKTDTVRQSLDPEKRPGQWRTKDHGSPMTECNRSSGPTPTTNLSAATRKLVCALCAVVWLTPAASLAGPLSPVPKKAERSSHAPYSMGMCASCHKGKSKANPGPLKESVNKTCNRCHSELKKAISKARFKHAPFPSSTAGF